MLPEDLGTVLLSITALAPFSASIIFLGWGIYIYHHLNFSQKQPKSVLGAQDFSLEQRYPWLAKQWQNSPTPAVLDKILQAEHSPPQGNKGKLAMQMVPALGTERVFMCTCSLSANPTVQAGPQVLK